MNASKYLAIMVLASFVSCNDFLDEKPTSSMTTDSELSSVESAEALVNGAYINTTVFDKMTSGWGCNTILLLEYMTGKSNSGAISFR